MNNHINRVLIIVGMHRSMTSLATQWLNQCGLNVGDDLYGAGIGNVKGHYEDKDFISLHDYVLGINNTHWRDHSTTDLHFDDYSSQKSQALIGLKNELYKQWGWKDPRTCLFLDHWNKLLPDARYLVVYRPFAEVVDSFLRREFKVNHKREYLLEARKYVSKLMQYNRSKEDNLKLWMHYNSRILDFIKVLPKDRFIVFRNDQLLSGSEAVFKTLTDSWGFVLNKVPVQSIFDATITEKATEDTLKSLDERLLERARLIQNELAAHTGYV